MLICTPTTNADGLDAKIHGHFGSAPYFMLFNTVNDEIQIIENTNAHHSHGTCHPMNQLMHYKIDVVLCTGMGRRAVEALNAEGVKTLISDAKIVKDAIEYLLNGKVKDIDPINACEGHGHNPIKKKPINNLEQNVCMGNGKKKHHNHKMNKDDTSRGNGNGRGRNR